MWDFDDTQAQKFHEDSPKTDTLTAVLEGMADFLGIFGAVAVKQR